MGMRLISAARALYFLGHTPDTLLSKNSHEIVVKNNLSAVQAERDSQVRLKKQSLSSSPVLVKAVRFVV